MGLKEGINIAATAENIKNQRARRLSEEERAKVYMEIAKMGADIQKQQFDMQKESHELKMQADSVKMQKDMQEHYAALINKAKVDKTWKRWNQSLLGGLNTPDMHQLAFMQAQEGVQPDPQRLARQKFIQEGFEPEETTTGQDPAIIKEFQRVMKRPPKSPEEIADYRLRSGRMSQIERLSHKQKLKVGALERLNTKEGPETFMRRGWRQEEDGSLYTNVHGEPEKLRPFDKVMGKRGMTTAVIKAGEHWHDAEQLKTLLTDPKVMQELRAAEESGLWDRTTGSWSNRIQKWMAEHHIAKNSDTATAIRRMQMMASNKRKEFLGVAVTEIELKSILAWIPDAGDSFDAMLNKMNLISSEGKETFTYFLDSYKDIANMYPFYKQFGIQRFSAKPTKMGSAEEAADQLIKEALEGK